MDTFPITWLAIAGFALNAAGCSNNTASIDLPATENVVKEKQGLAASFPRHDGVYRSMRQTTLIGLPNAEVVSYLVFTHDGTLYSVKGDAFPRHH